VTRVTQSCRRVTVTPRLLVASVACLAVMTVVVLVLDRL
jgi:hypothetical protein